ncbi:MAG: phage minor head protein [Sulfuricellaceae bacterium]|nr:phage minor head protein [Sulfuricellaceae bacterium]
MIDRIRLPFQEQIEFFRKKLNLPTARWDDILKSAHDRAFMVAGAMNADLLDDLRQAVDGAIAGGDTLQDFRKKFKSIAGKHGWTGWTGEGTKAGEAWRTKVIYQTNVASSHAAGRWQQLNDPGLLKARPYWRYIHNDSVLSPRPHHKAWGDRGLTLPHDHPFWKTHFPPNGWGCRCRVMAVVNPSPSGGGVGEGVNGDATEPPEDWDKRDSVGNLPGIDKGWDYAPGANADMPLRQMVQDKLVKYPAAIARALTADINKYNQAAREAAFIKTVRDYPERVKDAQNLARKSGEGAYGLSDAELVALHLYTTDSTFAHYLWINRALRGVETIEQTAFTQPAIEMINAALAKLPPYIGKVKRGTSWMPPDSLEKFVTGKTVTLEEFISTGETKGFKGNYQFEIQSKTGRRISFVSNKPKEKEVLMPSGLSYRVTAVETNGKVTLIKMEES